MSGQYIVYLKVILGRIRLLNCLLGLTNPQERSLNKLPPASFPEVSGEQNKQIFEASLKISFSAVKFNTENGFIFSRSLEKNEAIQAVSIVFPHWRSLFHQPLKRVNFHH